MTLQHVADRAGVSPSTVSRVINSIPGITPETIATVRSAMAELDYTPSPRRKNAVRAAAEGVRGAKVAFVVLQFDGRAHVPAYDHLLRGVSAAANRYHMDLQVMFVSDVESTVQKLSAGAFDGLVLHGTIHPPELARPLWHVPTVWLLGNRRRPAWGDQVMPDNTIIGQYAAQHLLRRGHRRVIGFGLRTAWWAGVRLLSFAQTIEDAGGTATVVSQDPRLFDRNDPFDLETALAAFEKAYARAADKPTGLFIGEDWLVRPVYNKLRAMGVSIGPGQGLDVISCNFDRAHLIGADPMPATIDIHYEKIAFRAVEQLTSRLLKTGPADRVRLMVEPTVVLPTGNDILVPSPGTPGEG